ncbi:chemotaxis protein methyltransferase CheR [Sphaerotilus hippei]|uniref:Chemotaxis protein methyltransferase n=1 Tax=Sphaerotilus hippei TaxID=744406 RepID=A0A318GZG7_9BURK|nr:CheR family methyltransferase [Sphaerotilus hippei]PXW95506.1 chemotaxis protein methyltransferase CheR [Sphaerotilus hippei]
MISASSFDAVTDLFHDVSGIRLTPAKRPLVAGRLQKLASARGLASLDDYITRLLAGEFPDELVHVVDSLTTNETYFFREPQHFTHLAGVLRSTSVSSEPFRVWSAASSSGEEAYSIAMVLAEHRGLQGWEVIGTDLSTAMVARARQGLYPLERARDTAPALLKRWCLKGQGRYDGQLLVCKELRERVRFGNANLTRDLPDIGQFDVIFLRNVLIYFDPAGKVDIVRRVLTRLKPGGFLYSGHAESIAHIGLPIQSVASAVYVASAHG